MVWLADSGAYFADTAGDALLAPVISPGKTWGCAGGILTSDRRPAGRLLAQPFAEWTLTLRRLRCWR
jgi:hypothetical protein